MKVLTRVGHELRVVFYRDPVSGENYEFLTSEMNLPAWVIVALG